MRKTNWPGLILLACGLSVVRLAGLFVLCSGPLIVRYGHWCGVARDILYPERFLFTFFLGVTLPQIRQQAAR